MLDRRWEIFNHFSIIHERMLPRETCWLLWMLYLTTTYLSHTGGQDCNFTYNNSNLPPASHRIFMTPNYPHKYPVGKRCLYIFIGKPGERVQMTFKTFNVQGVAPLCRFDYLDIYAEVKDVSEPLIDTPLLGRFCGDGIKRLPNLIVSMSNIIILDFYSDHDKPDKGFQGEYQFFDSSVYDFGRRKSVCDYTINSMDRVSGYIVSPTYPGMYPDNLHCTYILEGKIGQRIKITFWSFSLFHGGDYCPVDYVSVLDGIAPNAAEIGRFCGNYKNVVIYSTKQYLKIVFKTLSGRIDALHADNLEGDADFLYNRKGFNITYEFSDQYVKPSFSTRSDVQAQHIRGTACDVRISSGVKKTGTLSSPGYPDYPLPANVTCNYYLDGMKNNEVLEKVEIYFKDFDIPGRMPYCNSGFLGVNLIGSDGLGAFHEKYCGILLPPNLTSEDFRMIMTLDTYGVKNSRGFSSEYQFITDFGIPGVSPVSGKCIFLYDHVNTKDGAFNSPYYPANYPDATRCEYIFRPGSSDRLLISFYTFNLGVAQSCVSADNIIIDQNYKGQLSRMNTYCGNNYPGPIVGAIGQEMKIVFNSRVNSRKEGFHARFEFLNGRLRKCGSSITSFGGGGLIKSPDYPDKYKSYSYCHWVIKASKKQNKILVVFDYFHIEGKESKNTDEGGGGCKNAVMRVYADLNQPGKELCGQQHGQVFLSTGEYMQLEFITSSGALGAKGFKITWTEIHETVGPCPGFVCETSKYCIDNSLKCNGYPNCGSTDHSDEAQGCPNTTIAPVVTRNLGPQPGKFEVLHIAVGASISSFFCVILVICGFYHRKRFRNNPKPPDDHVEVRYVAASSSNNTADRLLAIDHTDLNGSHKGSHILLQNATPKLPNRTPNQVHKQVTNPSIEKISQCSSHSSSSLQPSLTSNQSPKIASIQRSHSRTPRIQKVSIV